MDQIINHYSNINTFIVFNCKLILVINNNNNCDFIVYENRLNYRLKNVISKDIA